MDLHITEANEDVGNTIQRVEAFHPRKKKRLVFAGHLVPYVLFRFGASRASRNGCQNHQIANGCVEGSCNARSTNFDKGTDEASLAHLLEKLLRFVLPLH